MRRLELFIMLAVFCLAVTRPARLLVVRGGSMAPAMAVGDVAVVVRFLPVRPGDVACFLDGSGLVCHRVVAKHDGGWRTRGDANGGPDGHVVPHAALVGRVLAVVPSGRFAGRLAGRITLLYHQLGW